jgi:hypothetical protein
MIARREQAAGAWRFSVGRVASLLLGFIDDAHSESQSSMKSLIALTIHSTTAILQLDSAGAFKAMLPT